MKKSYQKWFVTAASLIVIGSILFVAALAAIGFDFTKLSTQKLQTNTYELQDVFDKISIRVETANVTLIPADTGKVVCLENEKLKHSVTVQNGTLSIHVTDHRKWYDYVGIGFQSPKVTVYLPKEIYTSLSVETATGNLEIPENFSFETVHLTGTTSNIACYAAVSESAELNTTTGNITFGSVDTKAVRLATTTGNVTAKDVACRTLTVTSSTGQITLQNVIGKESILVENTTGNVKFDRCDGREITVKTTTGNVKGTLLSEKIFVTDTSTGTVHVPKTASGGKCQITTSTGNIHIEIP